MQKKIKALKLPNSIIQLLQAAIISHSLQWRPLHMLSLTCAGSWQYFMTWAVGNFCCPIHEEFTASTEITSMAKAEDGCGQYRSMSEIDSETPGSVWGSSLLWLEALSLRLCISIFVYIWMQAKHFRSYWVLTYLDTFLWNFLRF